MRLFTRRCLQGVWCACLCRSLSVGFFLGVAFLLMSKNPTAPVSEVHVATCMQDAFLNCMLALATGVAPEEVEAWDHELSGERPGCMPEWTGVATGADSSARYTR
jgi:hypothetical protein